MRVNPRNYGRDRESLLRPLALRHRLEYAHEVAFPGSGPAQIAFQLVGCGADLLSGLRYPDAVPTPDRKVAKRTAKMLASRFGSESGRKAAIFLAQAMAAWFVEMMSRSGDQESASVHAKLGDLAQQFFPLADGELAFVGELRAEYRVMDDHDTTDRVPATGWYMALADPDFAEGRDVDSDPELLEVQLRYASRYLRLEAERRAIVLCLGEEALGPIEDQLFPAHWPGYEILTYDAGDLSWWNHCAEPWHEAGLRALAAEVV